MKRLLMAILVLMMLPGMAAYAQAEELNLLWDIPFGVSPEVMVSKARENAGVAFVVSSDSDTTYEIDDKQKVSIIGFPVDFIHAVFRDKAVSEDGSETSLWPPAYSSILIDFKDHSNLSEGLKELRNINKALWDKYGEPSFAYFTVIEGSDESTREYYKIPLNNGIPVDLSTLLYPDEYDVSFEFVYKNLCAGGGLLASDRKNWNNWVRFSDSVLEKPKFTPYKIGEKKEPDPDKLPTPEPAVDTGF